MTAIGTRLNTPTDSLLRLAMRADAIITGLGGIALAAAAGPLASMTGLSTATEYGFAAFYIAYGVVVFGLASLSSVLRPGIGVVIANVLYTVAAVVVVLTGVWPLTTMGVVLALGSGLYTLIFAELQYQGVRRLKA
jgi:hypothetical protein